MAKIIHLNHGKIALVDDEDYERVINYRYTWFVKKGRFTYYACSKHMVNGKRLNLELQRFIMNAQPGEYVDHRNHHGWDNRKKNLRVCSNLQNTRNTLKRAVNSSSIYKGVHFSQRSKMFVAQINIHGRGRKFIGYFDTEEEAAIAYNIWALKYYKDFANMNIIKGWEEDKINETIEKLYYKYTALWNGENIRKTGETKRPRASMFRGVKGRDGDKWVMCITIDKIVYKLKFDTEIEAALTYNELALLAFGPNAWINKIP